VFQRAVKDLQWMATRGEPGGAAELTAFGEFDGLIYADAERVIRYMSGIAINFYGNIGYPEALLGKPLNYLETADDSLIREALETGRAVEAEIEEKGRIWIKRAVPLMPGEGRRLLRTAPRRASGALLMIRDETEARESARELRIKTTMIKEVHHRVKNDLQTVAALLRMQGRRLQTDEAQTALGEAVNRILSIAVIHEFLSEQDSRVINIREVAQRILNQMQSGVLDPTRGITLSLAGPNIFLPARQATSCALVVNELLQNALEHGLAARERGGHISLTFADEGETVCLDVHDDGQGLPAGFDLERVDSLGLRIVQMLVTEDLKGQFELKSDGGVSAIVRFPKIPLEGEIAWKELE
jgi:two-component sensor histidine kinase